MAKKAKKDYVYAVGRRKSASARVRVHKGEGDNLVNGQIVGKYFPGEVFKEAWQKVFKLTESLGKYHFSVKVVGGGKKSQLDAMVHGLSKAMVMVDKEKFRPALKKAGLLTRDSRVRERRKTGTGGRARRQKQSPKR